MRASFLLAALAVAQAEVATKPLFEKSCNGCHNEGAKAGGLNLGALPWQPANEANFQTWVKVFDKVRKEEMPPRGVPRPAKEVAEGFLRDLGQELQRHSLGEQRREGRTRYRRLNRAEYENTLRDLLGIDTQLMGMLPEDTTADGFDTIGSSLNLSTEHLEAYLKAANEALKDWMGAKRPAVVQKVRVDYSETWHDWNHGFFQTNQWTVSPEGFLTILWNGGGVAHGDLGSWSPPVPGARYRFRIRAKGMLNKNPPMARPGDEKRPDRRMMLKIGLAPWPHKGVTSNETFREMSPAEFREFTYEAHVPAGQTLYLSPHRIVKEAADEAPMPRGMGAVVEWVDIEGPLPQPGAQQTLSKFLSGAPRAAVGRFLSSAFRRPATRAEVSEYEAYFQSAVQRGMGREQALVSAFKMALVSPSFLFLEERPGKLTDYALASRLSYGFWSSLPDEPLLTLAAKGVLAKPEVLHGQVERMLQSPKSERFVRHFLDSWLNLRSIDFTQPDTKLYPEFEQYLQLSMVQESEEFLRELMRQDLGIESVVQSDFAMLNERLAEHYGISGVKGEELRKVKLDAAWHRGGFLTQGAILKVSANGTATSPVVRGAFIMDRILGQRPDPPPPNVASIEPDIRGATTIREQLAKHRSQASCAACHAKIDPPGFALESFDVTGRWRTHYRVVPEAAKDKVVSTQGIDTKLYKQGLPVDPSYAMADGRKFTDIDSYKKLIAADREQLARGFAAKLIPFLTGETVQFADREVVEQIVARSRDKQFGIRTLIHETVESRLFRNK